MSWILFDMGTLFAIFLSMLFPHHCRAQFSGPPECAYNYLSIEIRSVAKYIICVAIVSVPLRTLWNAAFLSSGKKHQVSLGDTNGENCTNQENTDLGYNINKGQMFQCSTVTDP